MQTLGRNKRIFYYALFVGSSERIDSDGNRTGTYDVQYGTPTPYRANILTRQNTITLEPQGLASRDVTGFDTSDMNCPINEGSIIWLDVNTSQPHNFVVRSRVKTLNSIHYDLEEVKKS